jgi:hypothetical protein
MKTELKLFRARMFCAVAVGIGSSFSLVGAAKDPAGPALTKTSIPWSHLGAKAGADYQGDGLAVSPTAGGARLRCVFQRLEGEATREGLWLTSTVIPPSGTVSDRFRVLAADVRRLTSTRTLEAETVNEFQSLLTSAATRHGYFITGGGWTATYIAKWDGSSWPLVPGGINGTVLSLAVSGSDVYAGGWFTTAGGNVVNYIAKWDGSSWSALGSGMSGIVFALAVSGSAYRLQRASSLNGPWATSTAQTAPTNGQLEFWDTFPPPGQGFYRSVGQ